MKLAWVRSRLRANASLMSNRVRKPTPSLPPLWDAGLSAGAILFRSLMLPRPGREVARGGPGFAAPCASYRSSITLRVSACPRVSRR
jgi:hypothetical protein